MRMFNVGSFTPERHNGAHRRQLRDGSNVVIRVPDTFNIKSLRLVVDSGLKGCYVVVVNKPDRNI